VTSPQGRRPQGRGPQGRGGEQRGEPIRNALLGIALVARGRREGLARFGTTEDAFLASLAPWIAFPLVASGLILLSGEGWDAAREFLIPLCLVLAPPVLSQALAQAWGRQAAWLHYATAFNWCQWAVPAMGTVLLLILGLLLNAGLPQDAAALAFVLGLAAYALWLNWFVTRHGLGLGPWRAALLVVLVNAGTALLALGPQFIT
jgi:hypothetical protein